MSFLTVSLVTACGDDDELSLDQAAEVDADAAAVTELHGAADVSFGGVTAAISGVTCSNEARFVVSPIVSDTFTLNVDGDPTAGEWNIVVTEPGAGTGVERPSTRRSTSTVTRSPAVLRCTAPTTRRSPPHSPSSSTADPSFRRRSRAG